MYNIITMSFLISVKSTENNNGYNYSMDFPEALVIDPNSKVSLVNFYYERQEGVVMDDENSYLYVKLGDSQAPLQLLNLGQADSEDTLEQHKISNPELSPDELANRIEDRFNSQFGRKGYTIGVAYLPDTDKFQITTHFRQVNTTEAHPNDMTTSNAEAGLNYVVPNIDVSGATNTTGNYVSSKQPIQTSGVPDLRLGGSSFSVRLGSQIGAGPNDNFGAGVVIGLAHTTQVSSIGSAGGDANTPVCDPSNDLVSGKLLCSLAYFNRTASNGFFQITEKDGVSLTPVSALVGGGQLLADSTLQISLDGSARAGNKVRYFFQNGTTGPFKEIKPTTNSLTKADWEDADLTPVIGFDTNTIGELKNILQMSGNPTNDFETYDFADSSNVAIANGACSYYTNDKHSLGTNFIIRKFYDNNSTEDLDAGVISPLVPAGRSSTMSFNLRSNLFNGLYPTNQVFINICDEPQRLLNVANGQTLGTDSNEGLTTDGAGNDRGNPKNPMYLQFRLKGNGVLEVIDNQNSNTATFTQVANLNVPAYNNGTLQCELMVDAVSNCARMVMYNISDTKNPAKISTQWFGLPRFNSTGTPNHIGNYSVASNNYRYHFLITKWTSFTIPGAGQPDYDGFWLNPPIRELNLQVDTTDDSGTDGYVELLIDNDDNDGLGSIIGFKKRTYEFPTSGTTITGEGTYDPHFKTEFPNQMLYLNCPTLNLRNVIGQKFKSNSTLAGGPEGNLQGINRYLAKIPRYHQEAGGVSNSKGNSGPFYYDYFPYSIPLNNATEINLNDLQLTLTDDTNAFATDVKYSEVLLSITQVESAGQSEANPKIGVPRELPQTYTQSNILQSQMNPTLK